MICAFRGFFHCAQQAKTSLISICKPKNRMHSRVPTIIFRFMSLLILFGVACVTKCTAFCFGGTRVYHFSHSSVVVFYHYLNALYMNRP